MPEITTTTDKIIILKLSGLDGEEVRVALMLSSIDIVRESICGNKFRTIVTKSGNQICVKTEFDSIIKFMSGNFEEAEEEKKEKL